MSNKTPQVDLYSWWIELLMEHNVRFERGFSDSESEPVAAIEETVEAVHLLYGRHYFFGVESLGDGPILYTFLPGEAVDLDEKARQELCGRLEHELNSELAAKKHKKNFEKYFVLPVRAGFETRKFEDEEYGGVKVSLPVKSEAIFNKKYLNPQAISEWRGKVFSKLNKFFISNASRR
jgi:hypothetical protein